MTRICEFGWPIPDNQALSRLLPSSWSRHGGETPVVASYDSLINLEGLELYWRPYPEPL